MEAAPAGSLLLLLLCCYFSPDTPSCRGEVQDIPLLEARFGEENLSETDQKEDMIIVGTATSALERCSATRSPALLNCCAIASSATFRMRR